MRVASAGRDAWQKLRSPGPLPVDFIRGSKGRCGRVTRESTAASATAPRNQARAAGEWWDRADRGPLSTSVSLGACKSAAPSISFSTLFLGRVVAE